MIQYPGGSGLIQGMPYPYHYQTLIDIGGETSDYAG